MLSDLFKDLVDYCLYKLNQLRHSRLIPLMLVFCLMYGVLVVHLFHLQILEGESAQEQYTQTTKKTVTSSSTRGNIYDCNGKLLAYNRMIYVVEINDTGAYVNGYQKNLMLLRLIEILKKHDEEITTIIPMEFKNGKISYTASGTTLLRFLRDMYGLKSIDDFSEKKPADTTAEQAFEYMKNHYGVGKYSSRSGDTYEVSDEDALACLNLRFSMSTNSYQKYVSTEAASDISAETMEDILEHSTDLIGVDVVESYVRVYNDSIPFASIIGYTGIASAEDIESLNEAGGDYSLGDVVGKTGIESSFESQLQGQKGNKVIYVDSEGHVTETESETDPTPGSDIYLTIDSELQVGIYHILEQQLAGILLEKIVEGNFEVDVNMTSGRRKISINDVYFHLLDNNVLDMDHFAAEDASAAEKRIYSAFAAEKQSVLAYLENELTSAEAADYKDLPSDIQDYMTYAYGTLKSESILLTDIISTTDAVYVQYRTDETMSFQDFLRYALTQSWIDTSLLNVGDKYTSAEETYQALVKTIISLLDEDTEFDQEIYDQMLHSSKINECDMCLALFDQGVLAYDAEAIAALSEGNSTTAYTFIRQKISSLELTPAQLAMDPCTAACTVVDPNTGDVIAMVSYPGYDNNRLNDKEYYASLTTDKSSPLYSAATQTRTAPGSTFKLVSTIAGLTEGVIDTETTVDCTHIFTKQGLSLKCTGIHGFIKITSAILHSCNVFFSEVGYQLSLDSNGEYHGTIGIANIQKYATLLGLGTKSGVEVTEMEPHVSDVNPIPSAIGQGSHSFTNVQLARYATTLANSGTVYDLTLLDKIVDFDGKTVNDNEARVVSVAEDVSESTWNVVHRGMYLVVSSGSHKNEFSESLKVAGKTGTAEENKLRPNHATFIGYAPYDDPQYSFAVTIPYGYSSTYSSRMCAKVMEFVEGEISLEKILEKSAEAGSGVISDED